MIGQLDYNSIPDSSVFPGDAYYLSVKDVAWEWTKPSDKHPTERIMCVATCTVDAPEGPYKGQLFTQRFAIGTDDDPEGDNADTWKRKPARDFKQWLLAVYNGAQLSGDPQADAAGTIGYPFGAVISLDTDNRPDSEYQGQEQNNIRRFFALGTADAPAAGSMAAEMAGRAAARAGRGGGGRAAAPRGNGAAGPPRTAPPTRTAPPQRVAPPVGAPVVAVEDPPVDAGYAEEAPPPAAAPVAVAPRPAPPRPAGVAAGPAPRPAPPAAAGSGPRPAPPRR